MGKNENDQTKTVSRNHHTARTVLQVLLSLVLLAAGVAGAVVLIKMKKDPARSDQEVLAPLVKTQQVRASDVTVYVRGFGTVRPRVEVDIVPEVSGKVISMNPDMKIGGFIRAGVQMLQIDPRDYELAVEQAKALVAQAQVSLDLQKAEADVARREWKQLHPDTDPDSPLVFREPQIREAEALLASAKSQLASSELRLARTSITMPFDVMITGEQVDLGQYIGAGQSLGSGYGIDAVEIEVPMEDEELAWFDVFGGTTFNQDEEAPTNRTPVLVTADFAGARHTWQGYVVRTTGQADRTSRMVSVIVEVPNPFEMSDGRPPLLPGVFAEVAIEGRVLPNVIPVPRDALRDGHNLWVVNSGQLHVRTLDIIRSDRDFAYVRSGLEDNAIIITSSLDAAVDGMTVRTQLDDSSSAQQPGGQPGEPAQWEAN